MSATSTLTTIEQFLARVGGGQEKGAKDNNGTNKKSDDGKAHTEAGGYTGPTTHPVKNVDDHTQEAKEGSRSAENEKDVKKDQGPPSIESAPEATPKSAAAKFSRFNKKAEGSLQSSGSAADDAEESELNPQPTGQTPDIETSSAKAGKTDPGSSHPARTDNDQLDGNKYSSDDPLKLAADFSELGNRLCAQISNLSDQVSPNKTASHTNNGKRQPQKQAGDVDPALQAQLGWELAAMVSGTMDKQAADAMVQNTIADVIYTARQDAVKTAQYLDNFFTELEMAQKQAAGEMPPPGMPPPGMPPGGGGMPPPGNPAEMAGGAPPPPGGGPPGAQPGMMDALGGGQPAEGGEGGGMGGGGGGGDPAEAQAIAQLLMQHGVTEEEIMQALQEEQGGGAGGAGGEEGGGQEAAAAMGGGGGGGGGGGMETAASDRGGKNKTKKSDDYAAGMRDYIKELCARSIQRRQSS